MAFVALYAGITRCMAYEAQHTMRDGTVIAGRHELVERAAADECSYFEREAAWVADLRAAGVKAAHPDDGWVDRDRSRVTLCYPQFNDRAGVGDLVALGTHRGHRVVRIVGVAENRLALGLPGMPRLLFEAVDGS